MGQYWNIFIISLDYLRISFEYVAKSVSHLIELATLELFTDFFGFVWFEKCFLFLLCIGKSENGK